MKFACKLCGVVISEPVKRLEDLTLLRVEEDGEAYLPQGYYHLDEKNAAKDLKKTKNYFIINLNDLINTKNHSNYGRLNGCCGLDGLDGMNKVCVNDHEIGTEFSDCWTLHYAELDPDAVEILE